MSRGKVSAERRNGILSRAAVSSLDGWLNTARQVTATLDDAVQNLHYEKIAEAVMQLALLRRKPIGAALWSELRKNNPKQAIEAISHLGETTRFLWALVAANQFLRDGREPEFEQAIALVLAGETIPEVEYFGLPLIYILLAPCVAHRPLLLIKLWVRFRQREPKFWRWSELANRAVKVADEDTVWELFRLVEGGGSALLSDVGEGIEEGAAKRPALLERLAELVRFDVVIFSNTVTAGQRCRSLLYLAAKGFIHEGKLDHGIALLKRTFPDDTAQSMAVSFLVESGHLERAMSVASEMSQKSEHEHSLNKLSCELGRVGRLTDAFDWADYLEGTGYAGMRHSDLTKQRAANAAIEAGHADLVEPLLWRFHDERFAQSVMATIAKKNRATKTSGAKIPVADRAEILLADAIARNEPETFRECAAQLQRLKARGLSAVRVTVLLARVQSFLGEQAEGEAYLERAANEAEAIKRKSDRHEATMWLAVGWFAMRNSDRGHKLVDSAFHEQTEKDEIYELMEPLIEGTFTLDCLDAVWMEYAQPHHENAWAGTIIELLAEALLARGKLDEALRRAAGCKSEYLRKDIYGALVSSLTSQKRYTEAIRVMEAAPMAEMSVEKFVKAAAADGQMDLAEKAMAMVGQAIAELPEWSDLPMIRARQMIGMRAECGLLTTWPSYADAIIASFPITSNDEHTRDGLELAQKLLKSGHCDRGPKSKEWISNSDYFLEQAGSLAAYEAELLARPGDPRARIANFRNLAQQFHVKRGDTKRVQELLEMIEGAMANAVSGKDSHSDEAELRGCLAIGEFVQFGYEVKGWRERGERVLNTDSPTADHAALAGWLGHWNDALNRLRRVPKTVIAPDRVEAACDLLPVAPVDELLPHAHWFADELETAWLFCAALGSKVPELNPVVADLLQTETELWGV